MKPIEKKVVDVARAIFTQKVANTYMEPGPRNETAKSRGEQFRLVAGRAFEAAGAFFDAQTAIEEREEVDEAAVERARAEIALNSAQKEAPPAMMVGSPQ